MLAKQSLNLIKARRTSRNFDKFSEVDKHSLERIIEAGIWAPFSIYQLQEWKFIVLSAKARDKAVEIVLRDPTVLKYIRVMYEKTPWGEEEEKWLGLVEDFGQDLGGAPVVVIALALQNHNTHRFGHNIASVWCAAQNMMLQAQAEGLDTGVVSFSSKRMEHALIEFLGYDPDIYTVAYLLNIGEAQTTPQAVPRIKEDVIVYKSE